MATLAISIKDKIMIKEKSNKDQNSINITSIFKNDSNKLKKKTISYTSKEYHEFSDDFFNSDIDSIIAMLPKKEREILFHTR